MRLSTVFLSHLHQHSSRPAYVMPHLGCDWRMLRFLVSEFSFSSNSGIFFQMSVKLKRICTTSAAKTEVTITIGVENIDIFPIKFFWKKNCSYEIVKKENRKSEIAYGWLFDFCRANQKNLWFFMKIRCNPLS